MLAAEAARGSATLGSSPAWPTLQALIAAVGLWLAWRRQEQLRLRPLLALALAFQIGWIGVHLGLGVLPDYDVATEYRLEGNALVAGTYPTAAYPPGAVLLFGLEAWIGGDDLRLAHALLMVPFQLLCVWAIWALRTRWSGWLAALVALWPLNAFFWEFKFDLYPTALLLLGLLLARRERWIASAAVLGLGAAVKWTPGLAALGLLLWLASSLGLRQAVRYGLAALATFAAVHLPFLLWAPDSVLATYSSQAGREITGESFPYLPLRALGLASAEGGERISQAATVPGWAEPAAIVLQLALVLAALALVTRARSLTGAVALSALVPVLFLATNRIFSPQFLVPMVGAWALAAALTLDRRSAQLRVGLLVLLATLANTLVYPTLSRHWELLSASHFLAGFALTGWLAWLAIRREPVPAPTQ